MKALKMVCRSALQSWGAGDCNWTDLKKTKLYPTKSGIVGLISCALGYEKNSPKIKELSDSIIVYVDKKNSKTGNILEDFQIIGTAGKTPTANGKTKSTPIVRKHYLVDACFYVYVKGTEDTLNKIAQALDSPYWPYYFGRKCCIPACRVNQGIVDIEEDALCICQ